MNKRLKSVVIGGGKISEEHLRFLAGSPRVELAGVCDLSPSLSRYAAGRFGAKGAFTDYRRMLEECRPDVVHILTPPHTHVQLITDCVQAGAHVVCEKPIAPSNDEFQRIWSTAKDHGRWVVEDHNYRFNRPIAAIEKTIADGQLGEVTAVDVRMVLGIRNPGGRYCDANLPHPSHRMPAGVVHEFITHMSYLLLRFMGGFDRVAASWRNYGGGDLFKYDDLDALVMNGPVHGRLRFECRSAPECFAVSVRGTKGWAETDLFQPYVRLVVNRPGGTKLSPLLNHLANGLGLVRSSFANFKDKTLQHTPMEGLGVFLEGTYRALDEGAEPPVGYQDMDKVSRLIDALLDEGNRI